METSREHRLVRWTALVVGDDDVLAFNESMHSFRNGWTSSADVQYPFGIVLSLDSETILRKIEFTVSKYRCPNSIEVRLGRSHQPTASYRNAKHAKYTLCDRVEFGGALPGDGRKYLTQIFYSDMAERCRYVWLTINDVVKCSNNPQNRVHFLRIDIFAGSKKPTLEAAERYRPKNSIAAAGKREPLILGSQKMQQQNPTSAVQFIKHLLKKKRVKAIEEGKEFEATVCTRAIQRIRDYEWELLQIHGKFAPTDDQESADRYQMAVAHCRDTLFRSIHLDLLLDADEFQMLKFIKETY